MSGRMFAALAAAVVGGASPVAADPVVGAILQFDGRFLVGPDQLAFKTARVDVHGTALDRLEYRMLPDFAGGKVVLQDAYVDVRYSDRVKLRFGKMKAPFGLERLQNEIATTFAERGLPTQLVPNRDLGAMVFGDIACVQVQLGIFDGVADGGSTDGDVSSHKELAARVVVHPVRGLALGAATTFGRKAGTAAQPETPTWKTQGGTTIASYTEGVVADGRHWRATVHGTWYRGPLGVLAEYVRSSQELAVAGTHVRAVADAWQVLAQWVLTGEPASYASVTPSHPFDPATGEWGAFDIAARVGELRFVDDAVFAGGAADPTRTVRRASSAGVGADWFVNRALRFVLDVERTAFSLGAAAGDRAPETSLVARVQGVF